MMENLRNIRAKHSALCSQVREVAAAEKESMDSIRTSLSHVMELLQQLQQGAHVEVSEGPSLSTTPVLDGFLRSLQQ